MTDPAFPYDASRKRRGPSLARIGRGFLVLLLTTAAGLLLWDFLILPFYAAARLHVTIVPLLMLGLGAVVLFWLFVRVKNNTQDPVRRRPVASIVGLSGFLGLNLMAFVLFEQGWSFISAEARWAGVILVVVNVNGAALLLYLFGMGWNRRPGGRARIHDAVVQDLRQARFWHEPPPYLHRKQTSGWRHSSSVYAHALYFEFARAYEAALEHLQRHLTQRQIDQGERPEAPPYEADVLLRALATPVDPCLKAGHALAGYLAFFDDVNGHRAWLAQEIAWRMLNLKLLHASACVAALPETADPAEALPADVADLKRLYHLYQSKGLADQPPPSSTRAPLHALVARTDPWRAAALKNRLCMLFLAGIYHTRHHDDQQQRWAALWQRPLEYQERTGTAPADTNPSPADQPVFFSEVEPVGACLRTLREQGVRATAWQAEHFFRHVAARAGLPSPVLPFLQALTALVQTLPATEEKHGPDTRIAVPGFDAAGLEDDLTNLLLALPQLDAEDVTETAFPTLWANASVLWMLEDLVFFERTLSTVQFKDVLQDPLWENAHPQVRAAARRLMQTPRSRQRWRENQARLAYKTNDPALMLQQTWERVPLAS